MKSKRQFLRIIVLILLVGMSSACSADEESFIDEMLDEYSVMSLEEIWKIEDPTDFIVELDTYICEKCEYGDNMSVLSEPERIFYIAQTLEMEVNCGGFSTFFYNSSGDYTNEIESVFSKIGANKTAEICKKAISAFPCEIPVDREDRIEMLEQYENEDVSAILNECDELFYEYEEDLTILNYEYVMDNKEFFD